MNLIIHIGMEKTGTSSIQNFLDFNRENLVELGYYYIESMGKKNNLQLPRLFMREDRFDDYHKSKNISTLEEKKLFNEKIKKKLIKELSNLDNSIHTVVVSSEHFHSRCIYDDEVENLKNFMEQYFNNISIITYIRAQVDVVISKYSTSLRVGYKDDLGKYIYPQLEANKHYYDYDIFLQLWERIFSKENICVRLFDKKKLKNNDLIEDFLSIIGIENIGHFITPENVNESINIFGQEILKNANRFDYNRKFYRKFVESSCLGIGQSIGVEDAVQIQKRYDESNLKVLNKWFPHESELFTINYNKFKNNVELPECVSSFVYQAFEEFKNIIKDEEIDMIKNIAVSIEKYDINKSYNLMKIAQKYRPNGTYIQKKIKYYEKKLKIN